MENVRVVSAAQKAVADILSGDSHKGRARAIIHEALQKVGYAPPENKKGTLSDHSSLPRQKLIVDTNVAQAQGYARWTAEQDADLLHAYPCQELIRLHQRRMPRDWADRWQRAGGPLYGGRMIARKDSPVWTAISRFGTPWPPFDFNSGMELRDISRREALALGAIAPDETPQPAAEDFNATLESPVADATPEAVANLKEIFGDQITVADGKAKWDADVMSDFYAAAAKPGPLPENKILRLGKATRRTLDTLKRDLGIDATGWTLEADLEHVRHAIKKHGEPDLLFDGSGEKQDDQEPLTALDFRAVPLIWRYADEAKVGKKIPHHSDTPPAGWPVSWRISSRIQGRLWVGEFIADTAQKILRFGTAWREAEK